MLPIQFHRGETAAPRPPVQNQHPGFATRRIAPPSRPPAHQEKQLRREFPRSPAARDEHWAPGHVATAIRVTRQPDGNLRRDRSKVRMQVYNRDYLEARNGSSFQIRLTS